MLPKADFFGLIIFEPTTMVTDYMITGFAWWCAVRLRLRVSSRSRSLWAAGFFFIGAAALLGGTSHGFAFYLSDAANFLVWKATVYAVGLSMLFAVAGTIAGACPSRPARMPLHLANIAGFAVYAVWMVDHSEFVYVIFHYVPAMISIALIESWAFISRGSRSAPWLVSGVIVTLAGAVIQQSRFAIHIHFNNNDLFHVVQIAGLYLFYRGCRLLA